MDVTELASNDISSAEAPLLNDIVSGSVDFKGTPANRLKTGSWKSASFIIVAQVAERFAYYGVMSNLFSYLTGPLGQSTAIAAENVNALNGAAALFPLLGAFVADSYLGRYWMVVLASLFYALGLGLLSLSAALHSSNYFVCKDGANKLACSPHLEVIIFFFSLYLIALAQGGHLPCAQAFGADQFDGEYPKECKAKSSFFNWSFFSVSIGILTALSILSYVDENLSWKLGFGIPCVVMCVALIAFVLGSTTYRFPITRDERNPFVRMARVFVKAALNWGVIPIDTCTEEESQQSKHHKDAKFKFLDKALVKPHGSMEMNVCTIGDVEDAKAILKLIPIWSTCMCYAIVFAQPSTLFIKQGATLNRYITSSFQIPSASLQCFVSFSIFIFLPIYDRIVVPIARAITKRPAGLSKLQRIGTGMFLSFLAMVIAALVEMKRLATAREYGLVDSPEITIPMTMWWLVPQYVLYGITDVFILVGLQEFFYDQVPKEFKSMGLALYLSIIGIGSFLSSILISVIENATSGHGKDSWFSNNLNRAHLDYFYWLLAGLSAVSMAMYVYFAKSYVFRNQ